MPRRILITGGAGFVGSHLADELLEHGYEVRVLDALVPQVHGDGSRPGYLADEVELRVDDVRDPVAVRAALTGVDAVFHLAAAVGVGQSMYRVVDYTAVNNLGTATLLEALVERPVDRLIVASSMSVYGEGRYRDDDEGIHDHVRRCRDRLAAGHWEPHDDRGRPLRPVPTPEDKPVSLESIYALSKFDQERMSLLLGAAYRIPTVALRLFNIYGTRQALSNPYTGVLAIFACRYLSGKEPLVFEDGEQRRDFVHVRDVVRAFRLALEAPTGTPGVDGGVFNIGSGRSFTIREVAERMGAVLGSPTSPVITGEYRTGDIRHCTADIGLARRVLGYQPRVAFDEGLAELAVWLETQVALARPIDRVDAMRQELAQRGLTR